MLNKKTNKKYIALLLSIVAVLIIGVGSTLAYIITQTNTVTNTFEPTQVTSKVEETIENNVKKNVYVLNTGTVPAYIRAEVIVTWQDENGNVYGQKPVSGIDYEVDYSASWDEGSDGFFYWPSVVPADNKNPETKNNVTGNLINSIKPIGNNAPEGYYLSVQILSSAIQADGVNAKGTPAVVDAWGVEYNKTYKTISK